MKEIELLSQVFQEYVQKLQIQEVHFHEDISQIATYVIINLPITINILDHINKGAPLQLKINQVGSSTQIQVGSEDYIRFTQWAENNTNGWHLQWMPISYSSNDKISISQDNFEL